MQFDKRIGIALVFAILVQGVGGLLWAGRAAERIDAINTQMEHQSQIAERLARLEARMEIVQSSLDRIDDRLDRPTP